ncbi:NAD(P)/FAD-dependent oxidoreductase [Congregibacter brevis]|uniref:NAD(P)/FAD-dependent oxidoreductase n=1 Tax=Congregibacter brevis TaxID=3081201 RepID=A0ABZ0IIE2_9GAMM|nr:NAD(P)/FAD-dependent oxidoreductase [Congregibacter sp. IMCC45268]
MSKSASKYDVVVVGGGASGLMCAISAGYRGLRVLVLEQGPKVGLKILVSGGGRCNFTNLFADPREHYLSQNPNFCISAMKRFSPSDFIQMVETAGIDYHEKKLGQLFCDHSAKDIVAMLLEQCSYAGVEIRLRQAVTSIDPEGEIGFAVRTQDSEYQGHKVVIASGGLSMPKIASDLAFRAAKKLGLQLNATRAALVPLTWNSSDKAVYESLSGISTEVIASCQGHSFRENLLFTHRGLSGPAILQISSFWREGLAVDINLVPDRDASEWLAAAREANPQQRLLSVLKTLLPNRLVDLMSGSWFEDQKIGSFSPPEIADIGHRLNHWSFMPGGSEGYRTAEVTLGGIDTDEVSSKTFELNRVPGLFAIGEALDVTGWLGGYNFQWAWASGWCCGQHL